MFLAAYPGKDPLKCTMTVFMKLLDRAYPSQAYIRGNFTWEMETQDMVASSNQEILMRARFPSYFPEDPTEDI